ncbi:GMC oxidoreductase, partial [Pseudonocardia bannensis]|nr:GMC oxidoreductase [Pseudonocardia bannensis]
MGFTESTYENFVAEDGAARSRLIRTYAGAKDDFDVAIVGSGVGGGILADDLAERIGAGKRILVVEAGSFLYPTHVYNVCRFPNADIARRFGVRTFHQQGDSQSEFHIGEQPQLNFGGRSIFWSGLIPEIQGWELDYFPDNIRSALTGGLLDRAGETMNESRSMGDTATKIVEKLRASDLAQDFEIVQTPRALHQPYLEPDGTPTAEFFTEPTGVFNTAELLTGQLGLEPGAPDDGKGLHLLLNTFVEAVDDQGDHVEVLTRNVLTGETRTFRARRVVLCGGSIESPKLLRRSPAFDALPDTVRPLVGRGLTDHPTSNEITTSVTGIGGIPIPRSSNVKIIFYSRGHRVDGRIRFPFNVEMNINHEWWHLRDDDPTARPPLTGPCPLDIKFSFANCLDDDNAIRPDPGYVPEIDFHNLSWTTHLTGSRIPATAGWESRQDADLLWWVLNEVTHRIFSLFDRDGVPARPDTDDHGKELWFGQGKGFGWGTVHHAAGSLRMPTRP